MKLVTFKPKSAEENRGRAGLVVSTGDILSLEEGGRVLGFDAGRIEGLKTVGGMLRDWRTNVELAGEIAEVAEGRQSDRLREAMTDARSVTLLPPLPSPGKAICPGLNFAEHISESRDSVAGKPPMPIGFPKFATTVIGPGESLALPSWIKHVDYEVEVAAVISRTANRVDRREALSYVAGYTILNDISARDVQFEEMKMGMLLLGKNFDGFAPMGPWLVTADEVPDPQELEMELWIEGEDEPRQKSSTRHMIFSFAELIEYWSQMTLRPGDMISSGTPSGVAAFRKPDPEPWYLRPGQTIVAKVEKLGELRTPVAAST